MDQVITRRSVLKGAAAVLFPAVQRGPVRRTAVEIAGNQFSINGQPTYRGRTWRGMRIEGLLMNARMVQGIFDDLDAVTLRQWAYPDTGRWDAERNTREFIAAMPEWRRHGLLGFTINLQGGNPRGYGGEQPHNSGFGPDGSLRPEYLARLEPILDRADELGMVPIVGYFYAGQDQRFEGDAAIRRAVREATTWLLTKGYRNVLVEIANEANNRGIDQPLIQAPRVHELVELAQSFTSPDGRRLPVSVSFNGASIPPANVVAVADFLLLHGNGVREPDRVAQMVRQTRQVSGYRGVPILFNEDDHFDFDRPNNNFVAAVGEYASWGYFDYRMAGEGFDDGYQSVPVNWGISSARKRAFFSLLKEMTGA
jgi:hypothetical protein